MITETKSKINLIVEAASDTIKTVVESIANNPAGLYSGYSYNAAWASRYKAITDLNILTDDGNNFEKISPEQADRYPYAFFFVDETINNPEADGEETFLSSLGLFIGVQCVTFAIGAHELNEIHHAIRSILLSDKQLDVIGRGILTPTTLTGTCNFKGKTCTGTASAFTTELVPGDWVAIENDITKFGVVDAIVSDTELSIINPYQGAAAMQGNVCKVEYVKRGAVVDVIKWQNNTLAKPEFDGDNIFLDMDAYFLVAYKEMIYQCC